MRISPRLPVLLVMMASLVAQDAFAAGAVVGHRSEATVVTGARMAVALSPGRMTRWLEVSVQGSDSGFVWLVPAAPGARVDAASEAWLDALDDASTPTILAPTGKGACDAGAGVEHVTAHARAATVSPTGSGVASDARTLAALTTAAGGTLSPGELASFDAVFGAGLDVVVLDFDTTSAAATTHAIQIVESGTRSLDVPWTGASLAYIDATLFVIADARASVGPTPLTLDPAAVAWTAGGVSTFVPVVDSVLEAAGGEAWLTESALPGRFFAPIVPVVTSLGPSMPTVLDRYFARAGTGDGADGGENALACQLAADALDGSQGRFAALCPAGQLATVPGPSPCTAAQAGDLSAAPLVCGIGAMDAAFALAGLSPSSLWLTRAAGVLLPASAIDPTLTATPAPEVPAIVATTGYDFACASAPGMPPDASVLPLALTPGTPPTPPTAPAVPVYVPSSSPDDDVDIDPDDIDVSTEDAGDASSGGGCDGSTADDAGDDASGGCSGDDADADPGCTVHRGRRGSKGAGVRLLMLGLVALAVARRSARRARGHVQI